MVLKNIVVSLLVLILVPLQEPQQESALIVKTKLISTYNLPSRQRQALFLQEIPEEINMLGFDFVILNAQMEYHSLLRLGFLVSNDYVFLLRNKGISLNSYLIFAYLWCNIQGSLFFAWMQKHISKVWTNNLRLH